MYLGLRCVGLGRQWENPGIFNNNGLGTEALGTYRYPWLWYLGLGAALEKPRKMEYQVLRYLGLRYVGLRYLALR